VPDGAFASIDGELQVGGTRKRLSGCEAHHDVDAALESERPKARDAVAGDLDSGARALEISR
jgi:hypothetical protein